MAAHDRSVAIAPRPWWTLAVTRTAGVLLVAGTVACLRQPPSPNTLVEAQGLASALHATFSRSVEQGQRVVMAPDDAAAADAAREARESMVTTARLVESLQQMLIALAYHGDLKHLDAFQPRFDEYRRLTEDVLTLALESTNVKAQRLAFGSATVAADAFHAAVDRAAASAGPGASEAAALAALRAYVGVLEIRAGHAAHIAEPDPAVMDEMEARMTASAAAARVALRGLSGLLPSSSVPIADARAALDRFLAVHAEIVELSRRNSNVRALSLAIGRRRTLAAEAEAQLAALEKALAGHESTATR